MGQFPNQKLTANQKKKKYGSIEGWAKEIWNSMDSFSSIQFNTSGSDPYDIQVLRDLYDGILNEEDFQYILKPYGDITPDYPAQLRHYDRISSKIHLLVGEEIKRPFNFKAYSVNANVVSSIEKETKERMLESLQQSIINEVNPQVDQEQPETPEHIMNYMKMEYQDMREVQANRALDYCKEALNLRETFNKGWEDLIVEGNDVYYTGISNNEPLVRRIDTKFFDYDRAHTTEYIEDSQWAYEIRWMPVSQIYEEYSEYLDDKQTSTLEDMKGGYKQNIGYGNGIPTVYLRRGEDNSRTDSYTNIQSNSVVKVTHFVWKSLRKIGYRTYRDPETLEILEDIVDENYKKDPINDINIEWDWINEVWEATKAGEELFFGVQPRPNQYKDLDNPNKCRLPYTGISKPRLSIVRRVKEIQYLFDIVMYRMELALAEAKGKKMVMDVAQIPKGKGWDMQKWLYYLDTAGIAFINSFEEGQGRFAGEKPAFNQFTQIDLTLSAAINQYVGILDKLDFFIEDVTGVTRQRQGQVSQYETAGGIERSVVQSSAITEYLFYQHNRVKKRVLTNLLEEAKLAWMNGKKTQYVTDDVMNKVLVNIDGDMFNDSSYGVFISDSQQELRIDQVIEQNAMAMIQGGQAELKDIVAVLRTNSSAEKEAILETASEVAQQRIQQAQQAEQQAAQQIQQATADAAREDREDKQAAKLEEIDRKGEWDVKKAEITAFLGQKDQDINDNNIPDQLEIERLRDARISDEKKNIIEEKKLALKDKEIKLKAKAEKDKNKVKPK